MRQTHRRPATRKTHKFSQVHEVGDVSGFGARQSRMNGPGHSPHGVAKETNREAWCTKEVRSGHDDPVRECEQSQSGSGYGRSSGKLVATLCATCLENGAASAGAHTRTEAVLAGLASIIWLKGALHGASCGTSSGRSTRSICSSCASGTRRTSAQANAREAPPDTKATYFVDPTSRTTTSRSRILDIHNTLLRSSSPPGHGGQSSTPCGLCCGRALRRPR
ncbi:MAG: hypothetical protein RLZ18_1138 [Actinomycetota bacterium]|jgi:hypothetical protein